MATVVVILASCGGCGTVAHGVAQDIEVTSVPSGAAFTIAPSGLAGTTPTTVELNRSVDHEFSFTYPGLADTKAYVHRTLSQGTSTANSLVPFIGLIGLGIDAASGGQFKLVPEKLHVDLTRSALSNSSSDKVVVYFYNADPKIPVHLVLDSEPVCVVSAGQFAKRSLPRGLMSVQLFHWDIFKFDDTYELALDSSPAFVALFSSVFSTHYAFSSGMPDDFTEVCQPSPAA